MVWPQAWNLETAPVPVWHVTVTPRFYPYPWYFLGASKGRYEISWIWLVPQSKSEIDRNSSKQVFDEGLQVEWSKSQARKMQWEEEVQIIQEEMQWTIVYYEWKQQWWFGITAYSQKQAHSCKCMAESFAMAWLPFLQAKGIKPEWESRYKHLISGKLRMTIALPVDIEGERSDDESNGERLRSMRSMMHLN